MSAAIALKCRGIIAAQRGKLSIIRCRVVTLAPTLKRGNGTPFSRSARYRGTTAARPRFIGSRGQDATTANGGRFGPI